MIIIVPENICLQPTVPSGAYSGHEQRSANRQQRNLRNVPQSTHTAAAAKGQPACLSRHKRQQKVQLAHNLR